MSEDTQTAQDSGSSESEEVVEQEAEIETLESVSELDKAQVPSKEETVPLKKYMAEKNERRSLEERTEQLQGEIAKLKRNMVGMSVGQVSDELKTLAADHNVDESFLAQLVGTVQKATKEEITKELQGNVDSRLSVFEQAENKRQMEAKLESMLSKALGEMPEYKEVVNQDVIKTLAVQPSNAKKTMQQLIEETYEAALGGKKTLEQGTHGRSKMEPEYTDNFDEIESNPEAREKWSANTEQVLRKYL